MTIFNNLQLALTYNTDKIFKEKIVELNTLITSLRNFQSEFT